MSQGGKGGQVQAGVNPMNNAAAGFQGAFNILGNAANNNMYLPHTYDAAQMGDPATIASNMGRYQNPYEDQVVQSAMGTMQDQLQRTQMGNSDAAIAAGAFGGGRHGVVEGVTNAEGLRAMGDVTGQLRHQGFNTAAGLAGQDIGNQMAVGAANQGALNQAGQFNATQRTNAGNRYMDNSMGLASMLGNMSQASYNVGRDINAQQMQSGQMTQQLMQSILQSGGAGFNEMTGNPAQMLQMRLAALGMNPLNNATSSTSTETTNPGWGAMFGNLLGAAGNMFSFNPISLPWGKAG